MVRAVSTSVGAATDNLHAKALQAVAGFTVNDHPVEAIDGQPSSLSNGMFIIGVSGPADITTEIPVSREWSPYGDRWVDETYDVPGCIDIRLGGKGATQKAARDICEGVFNAFWALVTADPSLGGALEQGRPAEITTLRFSPSLAGTAAEPAHRHFASFNVHCATTVK
jgi:hypothetical protein